MVRHKCWAPVQGHQKGGADQRRLEALQVVARFVGELAKFRLISFGSLFSLLKVGRECAPHRHAPHHADVPVERCRLPTSVVWLSCVAPRCATAQVARFAVAHEVHVTRPGPPSTLSTRRSQMSNNPSQQLLWGG